MRASPLKSACQPLLAHQVPDGPHATHHHEGGMGVVRDFVGRGVAGLADLSGVAGGCQDLINQVSFLKHLILFGPLRLFGPFRICLHF